MTNPNEKFEYDDYPALFSSADQTAIVSQKYYLLLFKGNLVFLIIAAIASSNFVSSLLKTSTAIFIISGASIITIILTILVFTMRLERRWYGARAMAESIKTLTWRYMMCATPFERNKADEEIINGFLSMLNGILGERKELSLQENDENLSQTQVSGKMNEIRTKDIKHRKAIYIEDRIKEQREWYSKKARANRSSTRNWFIAIICAELVVFISAMIAIRWYEFSDSISIFAVIAAAFIAWLQLKQHQELAQSYSVAAHELGLIEARAINIASETTFASYVVDSENAMSREHTLWLAKHGHPL